MADEPIQGLWVGPRLSVVERLSIASFLHHGHSYHLFTYGPIEGLPAGAVREDARAILPESMIFQYRDHASYAGFSNYFRYKLLLERGGWWADTDMICLRPFDFPDPYVFASQVDRDGSEMAASTPIKAPAGSPAMAYAWEFCLSRRPQDLVWGETGPRLVVEVLRCFSLDAYRQPLLAFCPVGYHEWPRLMDPNAEWRFGEHTYAVHLWNELWRREGCDKDRDYPPGCLLETWKRTFLTGLVT
jgi:mannosyltransferase OCH1-like enzyme